MPGCLCLECVALECWNLCQMELRWCCCAQLSESVLAALGVVGGIGAGMSHLSLSVDGALGVVFE